MTLARGHLLLLLPPPPLLLLPPLLPLLPPLLPLLLLLLLLMLLLLLLLLLLRRRHRRRSLTSALATARADRVSSSATRTGCKPRLLVRVRARDAWRTTVWRSCRVEIGVVRTCCSLQESGRSFRRCMRASSCATTCRLCASLVSRSTTLCRAARLCRLPVRGIAPTSTSTTPRLPVTEGIFRERGHVHK